MAEENNHTENDGHLRFVNYDKVLAEASLLTPVGITDEETGKVERLKVEVISRLAEMTPTMTPTVGGTMVGAGKHLWVTNANDGTSFASTVERSHRLPSPFSRMHVRTTEPVP